ncbi:MAG TPA: multiprotein bridging factor aMBF1 [Nitrososphaeraceae archaeon]|nr:multiprotein bridging factor aMBF1 [Nitrososphaeraceae archaeon]
MASCELCGRQISDGKKTAVLIDGTIFNVCTQCSRRGKPYVPVESSKKKSVVTSISRKSTQKIRMTDETILDPEFARIIREARMKKGLTHEQLGAQMNEKATLLKKFESGTLKPDEIFAKKLEIFLGIKLYTNNLEDEK